MKTKDTNISKISFICAIMVIALHSYGVADLFGGNMVISYVSHGLATVAVPTFFFLSGYLLFKNVDNIGRLCEKLKKRVWSLIVPYICWNILYFLFYLVFNYAAVDMSILGIIEGLLFHKYCFNLWFLLNLIVFTYVCSGLVFYLLRSKWAWVIWTILLASTFMTEFGVNVTLSGEKISIFSTSYFVYWLLGAIWSKKEVPFSDKRWCFWGYLAVSVAVMYVKEMDALWRLECVLVLVNTIFFVQGVKILLSRMKEPKYNMSMMLYGGAGFVQILYSKGISVILSKLAVPGAFAFLAYIVEILLVTIVCYYMGVFMKKYVRQGYRLLAGNR